MDNNDMERPVSRDPELERLTKQVEEMREQLEAVRHNSDISSRWIRMRVRAVMITALGALIGVGIAIAADGGLSAIWICMIIALVIALITWIDDWKQLK